jgi:hypothetical protein
MARFGISAARVSLALYIQSSWIREILAKNSASA